MDLVSMHLHLGRSLDSEPDLAAFNAEHYNADIRTDGHAFSSASG
jgi:hypothetical protein